MNRKNTLRAFFFAAGLGAFSSASFSMPLPGGVAGVAGGSETPQETAPESLVLPGGMDALISLEFRATDAVEVLRYLAQKAGINLSISTKVNGRVSLMVTNVAIKDVFDIVLRGNALAYEVKGNVYNIMTEAEYKDFYGEKFSDTRVVKAFRLQYAIPEQAFTMMDTIKSGIGRLIVDENSGTVMIMDTPDKIAEMENALQTLESEQTVAIIDLKYAVAADVVDKLKDDLETNKLGTVQADERTNQVIIKTLPSRLRQIQTLVEALDRKTREVLIDAKIIKVNLANRYDAGIDWNSIYANNKFHGFSQTGDFRAATDATTPGAEVPAVSRIKLSSVFGGNNENDPFGNKFGEFLFGTTSTSGYELMRFLDTIGKTQVISKPKLLVTENQEAKIHVGTREAYVTTTTTTGTATATTAEEIEFIDVGIQFVVKPRITSDGFIEMSIKPEISSVIRTLVTVSGSQVPIVDTSKAETKVLVKDGTTIIIGGLRRKSEIKDEDRVPYLNKTPVLGKLFFQQKANRDSFEELVILVTPHIMEGDKLVPGDDSDYGSGFKTYKNYNE